MARLFDDASSQYLQVDSGPLSSAPLTVSVWFNPDQSTVNANIVWLGNSGSGNQFWRLQHSGSLSPDRVAWAVTSGGTGTATSTGTAVETGRWQHGCGVEYAANSRAVYLNGGNRGTNTSNATPNAVNRVAIGRLADSTPDTYFSGMVGPVAIWNVALTDREIWLLSRGVRAESIRPRNLVGYWLLDNKTGTVLDLSGGNRHMAEFNTPGFSASQPPIMRPFGPQALKLRIDAPAAGPATGRITATQSDLVFDPKTGRITAVQGDLVYDVKTGRITAVQGDTVYDFKTARTTATQADLIYDPKTGRITATQGDLVYDLKTGRITATQGDFVYDEKTARITAIQGDLVYDPVTGRLTAIQADLVYDEKTGRITAAQADTVYDEKTGRMTAVQADITYLTDEPTGRITATQGDLIFDPKTGRLTAIQADLVFDLKSVRITAAQGDLIYDPKTARLTAIQGDLVFDPKTALLSAVQADLLFDLKAARVTALQGDIVYTEEGAALARITATQADLEYDEFSQQTRLRGRKLPYPLVKRPAVVGIKHPGRFSGEKN